MDWFCKEIKNSNMKITNISGDILSYRKFSFLIKKRKNPVHKKVLILEKTIFRRYYLEELPCKD